jgi:putative sterol carrier protein
MALAFSPAWAEAWCAALNQSETYRTVAAMWEGDVTLVVRENGGSEHAVYLDLHHGECRAARVATDADRASTAFALEAEPLVWRELLEGRGSPVMALMTGRLKLTKGALAVLVPYATAAKELLTLATQVDTTFPPDW